MLDYWCKDEEIIIEKKFKDIVYISFGNNLWEIENEIRIGEGLSDFFMKENLGEKVVKEILSFLIEIFKVEIILFFNLGNKSDFYYDFNFYWLLEN